MIVVSWTAPALRTFCAAWPVPWVSRATVSPRGGVPEPFDQYLIKVSTVPGALRRISMRPWRVMGACAVWGCAGFAPGAQRVGCDADVCRDVGKDLALVESRLS